MRHLAPLLLLLLCVSLVHAQNLLPNSSFEQGTASVVDWQLKNGVGKWEATGHTGQHCLSVTGDGQDSNYWFATLPPLEPGATYKLTFWGKLAAGTTGGCVVSGPDFVNKDWGLSESWTQYSYVFCAPPRRTDGVCRLGQWTVKGTAFFDDVDLRRVIPAHHEEGALRLGDGEDVNGTKYVFKSNFGGPGSNYSRLLDSATAGFNSSRWCLGPGSEVVYRQNIADTDQTAARISVMIGWYQSGNCLIEVSRDKQEWKPVGDVGGKGTKTFDVPADMLPAKTLYVRLRSPGAQEKSADFAPGAFQIHEYSYEATLARDLGHVQGSTSFLSIQQDSGQLAVDIKSLGALLPGNNHVSANVMARAAGKLELSYVMQPGTEGKVSATVTAGQTADLTLPYGVTGAGAHDLTLTAKLDGKTVWQATTSFFVPYLYDNDYGYALKDDANADLWWCEGTYKIAQTRPAPTRSAPVRLAASRGEFEPCQVVLTPKRDLSNVTAALTDFAGPSGAKIGADAWTIKEVRYLKVTTPTDDTSCPGMWPDPLPLFKTGNFTAGRNWPLWLTVKVPEKARAGLYHGNLKLSGDGYSASVPIELQVYDFTMPAKPHLQTAWGFSYGRVTQYQNLTSQEDKEKVFDLCMQDFRDHRIAPYDFFQLAPIKVELTGASWTGLVVGDEAAAGTHSLKIVDDSAQGVVEVSAPKKMPRQAGVPYRLAFAVKTAKPGQDYQLTLGTFDAAGTWFSGHNIDLSLKGSGQWERQEIILPADRFPEGCTQVGLSLRPALWTEKGENTGTAWFDDLFLGQVGGENLLPDPSFEDASQVSVKIDWTAFDKAAKRYLDDFGFSSFRLPVQFLPWGRSPDFHKGQLGPFEQGTPEYARLFRDYMMQLQTHLEQNGWLDKAYIYWFDEPEPGDYDFCKSTFQMLKDAAPKLTRMLTEQPEEAITGSINLWCPITPCYSYEACHARQKLGERIWWYVCTGPKAPLAGLFIDHGATDLRAWMWQTWQNDVQGTLVWESTWWDSEGSPKRPQNPWVDPMGWTPDGGGWGNGDGRFIYPANQDYPNDKRPYVEAPVDSIRWEMLREGLEDYEYLYLLREAIAKKVPGAAQYAGLLKVPATISTDVSHFCREPQPIYAQRAKLAAALEKLQVDKLGVK